MFRQIYTHSKSTKDVHGTLAPLGEEEERKKEKNVGHFNCLGSFIS